VAVSPILFHLSIEVKLTEFLQSTASARKTENDSITLSNDQLVVVISSEGRLTSIFDKGAERELLVESETAGFVIFEDTPLNWDAWDVGEFMMSLSVGPRCQNFTGSVISSQMLSTSRRRNLSTLLQSRLSKMDLFELRSRLSSISVKVV